MGIGYVRSLGVAKRCGAVGIAGIGACVHRRAQKQLVGRRAVVRVVFDINRQLVFARGNSHGLSVAAVAPVGQHPVIADQVLALHTGVLEHRDLAIPELLGQRRAAAGSRARDLHRLVQHQVLAANAVDSIYHKAAVGILLGAPDLGVEPGVLGCRVASLQLRGRQRPELAAARVAAGLGRGPYLAVMQANDPVVGDLVHHGQRDVASVIVAGPRREQAVGPGVQPHIAYQADGTVACLPVNRLGYLEPVHSRALDHNAAAAADVHCVAVGLAVVVPVGRCAAGDHMLPVRGGGHRRVRDYLAHCVIALGMALVIGLAR